MIPVRCSCALAVGPVLTFPMPGYGSLRGEAQVRAGGEEMLLSVVCFVPAPGRVGALWEHRLQARSTKRGGNFCLFSLSFFFPNTFKALTWKSAVKPLRTPAVVELLGAIHSVCSSTALRGTDGTSGGSIHNNNKPLFCGFTPLLIFTTQRNIN